MPTTNKRGSQTALKSVLSLLPVSPSSIEYVSFLHFVSSLNKWLQIGKAIHLVYLYLQPFYSLENLGLGLYFLHFILIQIGYTGFSCANVTGI